MKLNVFSRVPRPLSPRVYATSVGSIQTLGSQVRSWSRQAKRYPIGENQTEPQWVQSYTASLHNPEWRRTVADAVLSGMKGSLNRLRPQLQRRESLHHLQQLERAVGNEATFAALDALAKLEMKAAGVTKDSRVAVFVVAERPDTLATYAKQAKAVVGIAPNEHHGLLERALNKVNQAPKNVQLTGATGEAFSGESFSHVVLTLGRQDKHMILNDLSNRIQPDTIIILRNPSGLNQVVHEAIRTQSRSDYEEIGRVSTPGGTESLLLKRK